MIRTVTFRVSESALSSISFLSGKSSLASQGLPLFQVEGYIPAPNQIGLGWHKLAQTPISHLHLRTYVDDSPLQIPRKEGAKETKKPNKPKKKGQETVNFTVITLRQNISSVHCKKCVKAKLKREKGMLHELQCNRIIPSLSIFLPPHLVQFRKRIEYNTVR